MRGRSSDHRTRSPRVGSREPACCPVWAASICSLTDGVWVVSEPGVNGGHGRAGATGMAELAAGTGRLPAAPAAADVTAGRGTDGSNPHSTGGIVTGGIVTAGSFGTVTGGSVVGGSVVGGSVVGTSAQSGEATGDTTHPPTLAARRSGRWRSGRTATMTIDATNTAAATTQSAPCRLRRPGTTAT